MASVTSTELSTAPPTSQLHIPSIFQRASDFGSAKTNASDEPTPCSLEGYEGLVFSRVQGFVIPTDDPILRSWIYSQGHGYRLRKDGTDEHWWFCKVCHKAKSIRRHWYACNDATTSLKIHLQKRHSIGEHGLIQKVKKHGTMDNLVDTISNGNNEAEAVKNEAATAFNQAAFKAKLYDWIVSDNVSFNELESDKLRAL